MFVFRPPLSHSKKHHRQYTQWEMTTCARINTSTFHPKSYIFLPQKHVNFFMNKTQQPKHKHSILYERHLKKSVFSQGVRCILKLTGQLLLLSLLNLYQLLPVHSTLPPVHTSYSTRQLTGISNPIFGGKGLLKTVKFWSFKKFHNFIHSIVFSPWAGFSRNQSPVRRPVWLWHAASWASS
jgi:hypothetical protein